MSDYYSDKRLSASKLKAYLQHDPKIAYWMETHPSPDSDALKYGKALHTLMETKQLVISPYAEYRTKEAREWRDANPDALKADEALMVEAWQTAILNELGGRYPYLWECWKNGEYEKEYFSDTHKAKLDCIHGETVLDWKTSRHTRKEDVVREFQNYGAALQAAHYVDMSGANEFFFVVVSKVEPHPVWVLECGPEFLEFGRRLKAKAEAIREDYVNGMEPDRCRLVPPSWAVEEVEL